MRIPVPEALPKPAASTQRAAGYAFDGGLGGWRSMERPRAFVLLLALVLVGMGAWSTRAWVDRVVRAEGKVIPASRSQVIQHLEGGIVASIDTREGALVKKGDVLMSIADTGVGSRLGELQVKLAAARARIERLSAEIDGSSVPRNGPMGMSQPRVDAEFRLFLERQMKMRSEVDVLREQVRQKEAELSDLQTRKISVGQELETARSQLKVLTGLAEKRAASQLEVLDARARVERLETQLREAEGAIPKIRATISEVQARIRVTQSQFRTDASSELAAAQTELDRMLEEERAEKDRVARTDIRAPVDGMVNRLHVNTLGGVVRPGDPVMEITPLDSKILIEARVMPAERGELLVGLPARARISAYDFGVYGTLPGKLVEVSADTLGEERAAAVGMAGQQAFYRVQVEIDTRTYADRGLSILPGMTSSVDIVIGQRTIFQYLLSPLLRFNYHVFQESR